LKGITDVHEAQTDRPGPGLRHARRRRGRRPAIPPAFPLDATVAVNPFLGQTGEDLATASARLARVAGVRADPAARRLCRRHRRGRITDDDLAAALIACTARRSSRATSRC
jgi:hypothetical protein